MTRDEEIERAWNERERLERIAKAFGRPIKSRRMPASEQKRIEDMLRGAESSGKAEVRWISEHHLGEKS